MGYQIVYFVQQHELKEQAERKLLSTLNDEVFEKINASAPGIVWEEAGKEFYLNGQLYDIAKTKTAADGSKIFYCINDKNEEALVESLIKDFKNNSNDANSKHSSHTIKLHQPDLIIPQENTPVAAAIPFIAAHYPAITVTLISNVKEVNTPPPNKMHI